MIYSHILIFLTVLLLVYGQDHSLVLFTDISPANTSDSLIKIKATPLKYYEFLYDSVLGRKQLGILSSDAMKIFPESVDIVSQYTFPSKDKNKSSITLTNFPIVDKNIILIHGIAALQELIKRNEILNELVNEVLNNHINHTYLYNEINELINNNIDQHIIEKRQLIEKQEELIRKELLFNELKLNDEIQIINQKLNEEKSIYLYEEELLTKRIIYEENLLKDNLNQKLLIEKQLEEQKEILRRQTQNNIENKKYEYNQIIENKKIELEKEKILIELEAKAKQELANEDLTIRRMKLQSQLDKDRIVDIIKSLSNQLSYFITDLISQPKQLLYIIGSVLILLSLYYLIIQMINYIKYIFESQLNKPKLVRESSYQWTLTFYVYNLFKSLFGYQNSIHTSHEIEKSFADVILSNEDKERVIQLAIATRNTRVTGAPYRHVLLHGPPGTGKTLIARRLANTSDMDFAILSGGDVGPLGSDAVNQLHRLFTWASNSKRGLLVFIDESEAFLSSRAITNSTMISDEDSHLRHALNALLYQTGSQSNKFMLILATNRPEDLDIAILDRMDISLSIGLPGLNERYEMLKYYLCKYILNLVNDSKRKIWYIFNHKIIYSYDDSCFDDEILLDVSNQIEGFSGREISKLCIAMQYALRLNNNHRLTLDTMKSIVSNKISEHKQKLGFIEQSVYTPSKESNKHYRNGSISDNRRRRRSLSGTAPSFGLITPGIEVDNNVLDNDIASTTSQFHKILNNKSRKK